jgi:hypothetical protein
LLALQVVCSLLRHGYVRSGLDFLKLLQESGLIPTVRASSSNPAAAENRPGTQREKMHKFLQAAALALPDDLVTALMVLAQLPAPFQLDLALPLLALSSGMAEGRGLVGRLLGLGLLQYNRQRQMFSMHKTVREAALMLSNSLGE